ncbi:uncharacterized protein MJAP1_000427 [Malassezia japonica]|uniref:HpcH/HpaI aldolase/citrate lyase domain-containing protein n=1 Tax=Malassezia japonica TaxID=223818 RepID=A0AAF0J8P0_9BASI|nr:uncharacterized protein MJAP1_000427 [Malassezia japonica]WFD37483.1 hypothetical protein MJAP1_000427 [Malassezia japonica]
MPRWMGRAPVRALSTSSVCRVDRVRRSLLYVPGSSERMLVKSHSAPADTLVYDLEDSVAEHRKGAAQEMVLQALRAAPSTAPELGVRINAPSLQRALAASDLEVVLQSERLQALVLPKFESVEDVDFVAQYAAQAPSASASDPLSLILSVESARSLVDLPHLLRESIARLRGEYGGIARVAAVLFASEDYCAETGIKRTRKRTSLLYPRANLVTVAKALGIEAIDMVCIDYQDLDYLREECTEGAELGFDGKQAIHPAQLETLRHAFSPSEQEIDCAEAIIAAYDEATRTQHKGAIGLQWDGRQIMIDAPMLLQAQKTLARAQGVRY